MYGLVNQAVKDYIVQNHGAETWEQVRGKAGFGDPDFIPLEQYPDGLTFAMVGAACEVTGLEPAALVEDIGRFWVAFTAQRGYGTLLDQLGTTFAEALANLDAMHVRVALMMPNLKPPSFRVREVRERALLLDYSSHRQGLAPMVSGLVKGLGAKYGLDPEVRLVQPRAEGGDTDTFEVQW
jgi:hypothetical protein